MPEAWETKAEVCRKILKDSINPDWLLPEDKLPPAGQLDVTTFIDSVDLLTPREKEITASHADALLAELAAGKLTAVETTTAFLKRAHVGHQLVNFATEFLADEALKTASELDAYFKETGKLKGPLHGLPISVKEHVGFKNHICHASYVAWIDHVPEEDALLLRLLRAAGAVFHVRTNIPQTMMHMDCTNPIYGATLNPYNRKLTAGGSSGGEGACVGLRCSVIGIGTDIGGSVRGPAAFCGAYGLRSTAQRNPYKGIYAPGAGQESVRCIVGPLTNCVADLDLFQKVVLDQEPWEEEATLVPMPWRRVEAKKDFTVGVIWDDGMIHPHPPVTRALKAAVEKLKAAGIKVVDFEPYRHQEAWDVVKLMYFPDAGRAQLDVLEKTGEPLGVLTKISLSWAKPDPLTVEEAWDLNIRRDTLREAYHRLMKERGVDFILAPAYVGVAAEVGKCEYVHYTAVWNILDQPAITFPTGLKADPAIDVVEKDYKPRSPDDEHEFKKYVPETFVGAPIALQLVGKHFRDEETVAATEVVAKIIQA